MYHYFLTLLLLFLFPLESVEFVMFTQPKTANHLLFPILEELIKKKPYWPEEYFNNKISFNGKYTQASLNPDHYFFALHYQPWTKEIMDQVWNTTKNKNAYLVLHAPYSCGMENYLSQKNCINFFIMRDPRDQIISLLNHYKNIKFLDRNVQKLSSDRKRLSYMIKKYLRINTIHYLNWIKSPACCVLKFENLMGLHGGAATLKDAYCEITKIKEALELDHSQKELEEIYQRHFGRGKTFYKGKVGVWKSYFTKQHKKLVKREIGDLLIELGYEKNLNW